MEYLHSNCANFDGSKCLVKGRAYKIAKSKCTCGKFQPKEKADVRKEEDVPVEKPSEVHERVQKEKPRVRRPEPKKSKAKVSRKKKRSTKRTKK